MFRRESRVGVRGRRCERLQGCVNDGLFGRGAEGRGAEGWPARCGGGESGGARLVPARGRHRAAAVLVRAGRPRLRMVAPGIQPRADHPDAVLLHVPARAEVRAPDRPAGHRPLDRGDGDRLRADDGRGRQPGADRRHRLLFDDHLGGRADPDRVRLPARHLLLALGGASGLHAAAAAVHLLEAQHHAAVHLVRDRGLDRAHGRRAGLPRRQRDRPRQSTSCRWPRPVRGCAISSRS
jgi:hypothetical protein